MPGIIVTTSRRGTTELIARAEDWARRLRTRAVERANRNLEKLLGEEDADGAVIVTPDRVAYHALEAEPYFFHPNMARTRIHNLADGRGDPMVTAMGLREGDTVLDCTLGRAGDAIVAAHVVGDAGKVVGIEVVPVVAQFTISGVAEYVDDSKAVTAALRRIEAHEASYRDYLPTCPDGAFDVVYFDPIFDRPLLLSGAMAPLRAVADDSPLDAEMLAEARRVARRRVVIKQRKGSALWEKLGIAEVAGGPGSRIEYGVL
jgi:16S rRNA (guanine1516-N2)-methyltransferase